MKISIYDLSRNQITILKGLGMIIIVLHNFLHWTNKIGENEFSFDPGRIFRFIDAVIHYDAWLIIGGSFSFWGFLCIEVFIFASAYGLTKQFLKKKPASYKSYILPKLIKIYGLIIIGLVCYFMLMYRFNPATTDRFPEFVISSLLLYNNFSFDIIFSYPYIGPWWYFSFIIQLYLIFPLLYFIIDKYKKRGLYIMFAVSCILIYALLPVCNKLNIPLFANFIGHLPEFILAIGFAMYKDWYIDYKTVLPALCIFILSWFSEYFFPLSFVSATILIIYFCHPIYNCSWKIIQKPLLFVGGISMFMFLINGPLRAYSLRYMYGKEQPEILLLTLIHLLTTIVISFVISIFYNNMISPHLNRLIKKVK